MAAKEKKDQPLKKPHGGSFYHRFTEDECSLGGAEARQRERQEGKKLNHGRLFGKRV